MCFYTNNNHHSIAKKDIVVYKVICKDNSSLCYGFNYIKNIINEPINIITKYDSFHGFYYIDYGYHSFDSIKTCLNYIYKTGRIINRIKISKFIIPKGIKFFEDDNTLVSENIIYKSDIKFIKLKLFIYELIRKIKSK